MSVLIFIAVLVVLIVVHELGHFFVAKWVGMRVDEFGIGYPPRALTMATVGETRYTLNWIPFGGFVKIHGEDGEQEAGAGSRDARAFGARGRLAQAIVLVAGIAMNLLLAYIIFTIIFMTPHWVSDHEIERGLPLFSALYESARVTVNVTAATASGLLHFFGSIFTFSANLSQVSGPIGIAGAVGSAARSGWQALLSLTAVISINLALINLLPIPALDGGRLLFVIIEAITRRPIRAAISGAVNALGFAFLILLMLVVTAHDLFKIFT